TEDVTHPKSGEVLIPSGEVIVGWDALTERIGETVNNLNENDGAALCSKLNVVVYAGEELTGDKLNTKGEIVEKGTISLIRDLKIEQIRVLYLDDHHIGDSLWKTLM